MYFLPGPPVVKLLGSLTLLLSAWLSSSNKVSCFVSTCFCRQFFSYKNVRQEPALGALEGPPSCKGKLTAEVGQEAGLNLNQGAGKCNSVKI